MPYFLYILRSEKDQQLYVGITADVDKRLKSHNAGSTRSTKHRRPFIVLYTEEHPSRQIAREREKFLKSYVGAKEKIEIIKNCGIV